MTNLKCNLCGAVNGVADEVCQICGAELHPEFSYREPPPLGDDDAPRPTSNVIPPFNGPGDAIGPTISLFTKNIWLITKIVFVIVAPFEIFKALSVGTMQPDWQLMIGIGALYLLCNALIVPALFYSLMKVMETGSAPSVNEAYLWGLSKIPKLSLSAVMSWILIVFGTLLCIIPGIILSLAFHVVYPIAVFEKGSAVEVLERSYEITKGHRWNIFAAGFVIAILVGLCSIPASAIVAVMVANGMRFLPLEIGAAIFTDILGEASTVFSLVVYLGILRTLGGARSVIK